MKILKNVPHVDKQFNIHYSDFELLEKSKIIDVIRKDKAIYEMRSYNSIYYCNCPANDACWHLSEISNIYSQKSVSGFEADLAEEAGILRLNDLLKFPKYKRRRAKV